MRTRTRNENITPRFLDITAVETYLSVGSAMARRIGKESGAARKIGSRTVYDRFVIDDFMDSEVFATGGSKE